MNGENASSVIVCGTPCLVGAKIRDKNLVTSGDGHGADVSFPGGKRWGQNR